MTRGGIETNQNRIRVDKMHLWKSNSSQHTRITYTQYIWENLCLVLNIILCYALIWFRILTQYYFI